MKMENFNLHKMYVFNITVYPEDRTKYSFLNGESSYDISGLLFADNIRDALEKLYKHIGVEYGKTICLPNIRHFVDETIPYMSNDKLYCTGFSTHYE